MPDHVDNPVPSLLARHRRLGGAHVDSRRVTGVHRAEGLAGPTGRYLFIVALLAGTASLPMVAALGAGSATTGGTALPGGTTPFIGSPSDGPVVVVPLPPTVLDPDEPPLIGVLDPLVVPADRNDAAGRPGMPDRPRSRHSDRPVRSDPPEPGAATVSASGTPRPHPSAALHAESSQPPASRPTPPVNPPGRPPAVEPKCRVPRWPAAVDGWPAEVRHGTQLTPAATKNRMRTPDRTESPGERHAPEGGTDTACPAS